MFGLSDYHQERTSPTYSQRKNNPRQLHPTPKSSCAQNVVVLKWSVSLAPNPCTTIGRAWQKTTSIRPVDPSACASSPPQMIMWRNVNCGRVMGRRVRIPWWWWRRLITVRVLMWLPNAKLLTKCTSCTERPLPRLSGYEPVLSRRRFVRSTCTWAVSSIPCLTKTLHQSYNDGMVNPEVVCHPYMAKTTAMHANSLPPFLAWLIFAAPYQTNRKWNLKLYTLCTPCNIHINKNRSITCFTGM